jgi:hypothetical protein
MTAALIITFGLFFYLLPSVIATTRKVRHDGAIVLVNVVFGWTILGWIAALIWAIVEHPWYPSSALEGPEQLTADRDERLTVNHTV